MPTIEKTQDYIDFMHLLQNTHPDLCTRCWKNLVASIDGEDIIIKDDQIDADTYYTVINISKQYSGKRIIGSSNNNYYKFLEIQS